MKCLIWTLDILIALTITRGLLTGPPTIEVDYIPDTNTEQHTP